VQLQLKRLTLAELVGQDPVLAASALLKALPPPLQTEFLSNGTLRRVGSQASIFHKGDMVGPLYLVLRGEVRLINGEGVEVARVIKGEFFGESELLVPGTARRGGAEAATDVDFAEFAPDYVTRMLMRAPSLRILLGRVDAERTRAHSELDDFLNRW
jgi:CRP-like cAMP-binding protein